MNRAVLALLLLLWAAPAGAANVSLHVADVVQTKLNNLNCGDHLQADAGVTWTTATPYYLTKPCGSNHIIIEGTAALPAVCVIQNDACFAAWIGNAANYPKFVASGTNSVFETNWAASGYEFKGVEIANSRTTRGDGQLFALVYMGTCGNDCTLGYLHANVNAQLPSDITFRQVYFHGNTSGDLDHGVIADANGVYFYDCYIEDVHDVDYENHGIIMQYAAGPIVVDNTYISASGINFMLGGNEEPIVQVPTGITFTNNRVTKQLSWYAHAADVGGTYGGIAWVTKNLWEAKRGQDITINHNLFTYSWDGVFAAAQYGVMMLLQMVALNVSTCSGCKDGISPAQTTITTKNVSITNNVFRHGGIGLIALGAFDSNAATCCAASPIGDGLTFRNNLLYDISPVWAQDSGGNSGCYETRHGYQNLTIDHVTCDDDAAGGGFNPRFNFYSVNPKRPTTYMTNFTLTNTFGRQNQYGFLCDGVGIPVTADCLNAMAPGPTWTFSHNILAEPSPFTVITMPATNVQLTAAAWNALFVDRAIGHVDDNVDYHLVPGSVYKAGGASQASDATDVGVNNWCALPSGPWNTACVNSPVRLRRR